MFTRLAVPFLPFASCRHTMLAGWQRLLGPSAGQGGCSTSFRVSLLSQARCLATASDMDEEIEAAAQKLEKLKRERARRLASELAAARGEDETKRDAKEGEEEEEAALPLKGVRVLDLSRILAGPFCTMLMGDLGAEVIKVEKRAGGDDTRSWGPPFVGGESTYFMCVNRNKKSVTLDLRAPKARQIIYDLAAKESDVVVENFIPGAAAKLGIDYDTLRRHNEGLIYASISGYGSTGPYKTRPGYDVNIAAMGGMMSVTGERGGAPVKVGVALTDIITGLLAQGCISSALVERNRSGRGRHIELSLLDSQVASLANVASSYLNGGVIGERWGTAHASIVPYQGFEASDGYVVISANNDDQWQRLCLAMDRKDLGEDERFLTNAHRVAHRDIVVEELAKTFNGGSLLSVPRTRSRAEWIARLTDARLSVCPINNVKEVFEDEHVLARGMKQTLEHPTAGQVHLPGIPFMLDGSRPVPRRHPPLLGQDTTAVLEGVLGLGKDDIAKLVSEKVV